MRQDLYGFTAELSGEKPLSTPSLPIHHRDYIGQPVTVTAGLLADGLRLEYN